MNNVSFQGNITVTTWDNLRSTFKTYPTTQAQDKLLKHVADSFCKPDTVLPLAKNKANFMHRLVEKIIGKPVRNISGEKAFYNGGDKLVLSDRNPRLLDGTRIDMDLGK